MFPVSCVSGLGLSAGTYRSDHDLLPPSAGSLGAWEVPVLTENCPVAGAMEREAQGALASREGPTDQTGLSNIWKQVGRTGKTWVRSIEAGSHSQLYHELEGVTFQHLLAA